jgi:flagellar protein FliO/FliZ
MRIFVAWFFLCVPAIACAAGGKTGDGGNMVTAVFQMIASLALVLGIIYLLYYISTRWFKGGAAVGKTRSGHIRVVETRYLAPKRSLLIVEVGGEYLLLGNGTEGVHLIKKLENGDEFEAQNAASLSRPAPEIFRKTFDDLLKKMQGGLSVVKRSDTAAKKIWSAEDQIEPITVEQMIEQMQPQISRSGSKPIIKHPRAKLIGDIC